MRYLSSGIRMSRLLGVIWASFSSAFEVLGTCAGELHEALDGGCCDDD
jgi:hypothetical protein